MNKFKVGDIISYDFEDGKGLTKCVIIEPYLEDVVNEQGDELDCWVMCLTNDGELAEVDLNDVADSPEGNVADLL